MHVLPQQVTYRNILTVLLTGFGLVILLLVVAGFIGTANIRSIQRNAATLVEEHQDMSDLIDEIQSEQAALNAVFYNLAREPRLVDRAKILSELDAADNNISDIASQTEEMSEAALGKQLKQASEAFTKEARRLLALENTSTLLSRDLFRRHLQVTQVGGEAHCVGTREVASGAADDHATIAATLHAVSCAARRRACFWRSFSAC